MGYLLMWIEGLAAAVLLVATVTARCGRAQKAWWRVGLPLAIAVLVLIAAAVTAAGAFSLRYIYLTQPNWVAYTFSWTLVYGGAATWLLVAAWRRREDGSPAAARWPAGRLLVGFAAALALDVMTFWNVDLSVRAQLAALRAEAGALALTVAPARVPDRSNAALVYQQAFDEIDRLEQQTTVPPDTRVAWTNAVSEPEPGVDFADPQLRAYLAEHHRALDLLRRAAAMADCYFERNWGRPSIDMLLPEMPALRNAGRLLVLEARSRAAAGDAPGAVEDVNAAFGMAAHVRTEPILIGALIAMAIDATAVTTTEDLTSAGRVSAADLATIRLDENVSYRRVVGRAFRMEEAFGLTCFTMMADDSAAEFLQVFEGPAELGASPLVSLWRVFLLPADLASYRRLLREYQDACQKPFYETHEEWQRAETGFMEGKAGVMTRLLVPALSRCFAMAAEADARQALVRTALAAVAYRAKHGKGPASLEDLVPEFLPVVPVDPFDGKPLRLAVRDGRPVLYSVGSDLKDGGGEPLDKQEKTGDLVFRLPAE